MTDKAPIEKTPVFPSARLRLGNEVSTFDHGHDCALLNRRRRSEPEGVHSSEQLRVEMHRFEGFI